MFRGTLPRCGVGLALALCLLLSPCFKVAAATVTGTIYGADGELFTGTMLFRTLRTPLVSGSTLVTGGDYRISLTNGALSTTLLAGDYRVFIGADQKGFIAAVPSGSDSYSILGLITNAITYTDQSHPWQSTPPATASISGTVKTDVDAGDPVVYLKSSIDTLLATNAAPSKLDITNGAAVNLSIYGTTMIDTGDELQDAVDYLLALTPNGDTATSNDAVPRPQSVATIASLVSDVDPALVPSYARVFALGYHAAGDGGGGVFMRVSSGSFPAELGTVFQSTVDPTYSWWRIYSGPLDVRWFGITPDDAAEATNNVTRWASLQAYGAARGDAVEFAGGDFYFTGELSIASLTSVSGVNAGGSQVQTNIRITDADANGFVDLESYTTISDLNIRVDSRWTADSNTAGAAISGGEAASVIIENVVISDFYYGIKFDYLFDASIRDVSFDACVIPFFAPDGGSHNSLTRVAARGQRYIVDAGNANVVAQYTAGTDTVTLDVATNTNSFAVNDLIRVFSDASGESGIARKLWFRKVTAVNGDGTITIDRPWSYSCTNATLTRAVGKGNAAFTMPAAEASMETINIEWGAWERLCEFGYGPGSVSIRDLHVEGMIWDASGSDVTLFSGIDMQLVVPGYLHLVNNTVQAASTFALTAGTMGIEISSLYDRDWDIVSLSSGNLRINRVWSPTYPYPVSITSVTHRGATWTDSTDNAASANRRRRTYAVGQYVTQREIGNGLMAFYGYSGAPTATSTPQAFQAGDVFYTPSGTMMTTTSGTLGTPTGNYKIRSGGRVAVVNAAGRSDLYMGFPFDNSGQTLLVETMLRSSVASTTLSADAASGDTYFDVVSATGITTGDWVVIDFAGSFEEVRVARVTGSRVFVVGSLSSEHSSGATVETGMRVNAASSSDITSATAIAYPTPAFAWLPSVDSSTGLLSLGGTATGLTINGADGFASTATTNYFANLVSIGETSDTTVLDLYGSSGGISALRFLRDGSDTYGIANSSGLLVKNNTSGKSVGRFLYNATDSRGEIRLGAGAGATNIAQNGAISSEVASGGTNQAGSTLSLIGGGGTGDGAGGVVTVSVSVPQASGTDAHSYTNVLVVDHDTFTAFGNPVSTRPTTATLTYSGTNVTLAAATIAQWSHTLVLTNDCLLTITSTDGASGGLTLVPDSSSSYTVHLDSAVKLLTGVTSFVVTNSASETVNLEWKQTKRGGSALIIANQAVYP